MRLPRENVLETFIAVIVLATIVFLGWPAITQQNAPQADFAPCGCPEIAKNGCEQPCSGCCDDPKTAVIEPCPCEQENPTSDR